VIPFAMTLGMVRDSHLIRHGRRAPSISPARLR